MINVHIAKNLLTKNCVLMFGVWIFTFYALVQKIRSKAETGNGVRLLSVFFMLAL